MYSNSNVYACIHLKHRKSLEKYRKSNFTHPLKCKQCVSEQESKERALAASKASASNASEKNSNEEISSPITCNTCNKSLEPSFYNRNQLSKGEGKARCRSCVDEAIAKESLNSKEQKEEKLVKAREKVRLSHERGNVVEKVKAEAELSALEAEIVTGLKPVVLGRGRSGRFTRARGNNRGGRGRSQRT